MVQLAKDYLLTSAVIFNVLEYGGKLHRFYNIKINDVSCTKLGKLLKRFKLLIITLHFYVYVKRSKIFQN